MSSGACQIVLRKSTRSISAVITSSLLLVREPRIRGCVSCSQPRFYLGSIFFFSCALVSLLNGRGQGEGLHTSRCERPASSKSSMHARHTTAELTFCAGGENTTAAWCSRCPSCGESHGPLRFRPALLQPLPERRYPGERALHARPRVGRRRRGRHGAPGRRPRGARAGDPMRGVPVLPRRPL